MYHTARVSQPDRVSDDNFVSFRTNGYKLHYYETPTNLRFVMLTDIKMGQLRAALHQIYVNLYVEFVVKNPLSRTITTHS